MNNKTLIVVGLLVFGVLIGVFFVNKPSQNNTHEKELLSDIPDPSDFLSINPEVQSLSSQNISADEKEGLLFMREEEKLARDVYITLHEKWGLNIFKNISQSEQTHTDAVRTLLIKYNITDPVSDDSIGKFVNTTLTDLYGNLIIEGQKSLIDALKVGALVEDLDIKDLQKQIAQTDNEDIKLVYNNLMKGSRNHLRAFVSQIESRGSVYQPKYLTQEEFDAIISSPRETGPGSMR